ncbi:SLC22A25 [Acrasis kona]|uniref:SLC22A25 n=1 Tax=Acrasis kona TaxID=1008807 RepID=A0AAW2ZMT4_9EUKA
MHRYYKSSIFRGVNGLRRFATHDGSSLPPPKPNVFKRTEAAEEKKIIKEEITAQREPSVGRRIVSNNYVKQTVCFHYGGASETLEHIPNNIKDLRVLIGKYLRFANPDIIQLVSLPDDPQKMEPQLLGFYPPNRIINDDDLVSSLPSNIQIKLAARVVVKKYLASERVETTIYLAGAERSHFNRAMILDGACRWSQKVYEVTPEDEKKRDAFIRENNRVAVTKERMMKMINNNDVFIVYLQTRLMVKMTYYITGILALYFFNIFFYS